MVRTRGSKNSTKAAVGAEEIKEQLAITNLRSEAEAPIEPIVGSSRKRAREEKEETAAENMPGAEEDGANDKSAVRKDETEEEVRSSTMYIHTHKDGYDTYDMMPLYAVACWQAGMVWRKGLSRPGLASYIMSHLRYLALSEGSGA